MFGITSSGCFVIGTITGFIAASVLGIAVYFYYHPDRKSEHVQKVEEVWGKVKNNGDHYIKVIKDIPIPEPAVPGGK